MKLCTECHKAFPDDVARCPDHGDKLKPDPLLGKTLGAFHITDWLGEGGMGILYRARHEVIGRKAAVKVIKGEYITDARMAGRFEQEARTVARIGHPHLIDIFDIGTTPDGRLYYVMELLEGRSLASRITSERPDFHTFATLLIDSCQALEAAHAVQIVHRDLKPDNIFLVERPGEPPFAKVLDFGIAKVLGMDEDVQKKLTKTGSIIGTPTYMAPEQIKGGKIDSRADIYALGVILYELCVGRPPFVSETMGALLVSHLLEATPSWAELPDANLAPGVPPEMEAVCFRALAKNPEDRYQTVGELREDLERLVAGQTPSAVAWWQAEKDKAAAMKTAPGSPLDTVPGGPPAGVAGATIPDAGPTVQTGAAATMPGGTTTAERTLPVAQPKGRGGLYAGLAVGALAAAGVAVVVLSRNPPPPPPPPTPVVETPPAPPPKPPRPKLDLQALRSKAIGVLSAALNDGDPEVRTAAATRFAEGRDPRHHSMVERLLGDLDPEVKKAAASTLGDLGSRASLPPLRAALDKEPPALTPAVGGAVVKLDEDKDRAAAVQKLRKLLRAGDAGDRILAALVLASIERDGDQKEARAFLAKIVEIPGTRPDLVARALGALAQADEKARARLQELLDAPDPRVVLAAATELLRLNDDKARAKLQALAERQDSPERLRARLLLAANDEPGDDDLFRATFTDESKPASDRGLAAQGLAASGSRAVLLPLSKALGDENPQLRVAAAGAILAIAANDPEIRKANTMGWTEDAIADASWEVRLRAALALGDSGDSQVVVKLVPLLKDERAEVRAAAITALAQQKTAEAARAIGEALDDKTSDVRELAVKSLAQVGGEAAAPILEKHLEKATGAEKVLAAGALLKLGKRTHVDELREALKSKKPEERRAALEEAAADPELGAEALATGLKDSAPAVRLTAALRLADKGSQDGVPELQKAVKKGGADGLRAYVALTRLSVEPEKKLEPEALLEAKDPKLRALAVEEAARLPDEKALSFYQRALRDRDAGIRMAALGRVGEIVGAKPSEGALKLLRKAVRDTDAGVRARAESLLAKYAPKPAPEPEEKEEPATKATPTGATGATGATPAVAPPPDLGMAPAPPDLGRPVLADLAVAQTGGARPFVPDLAVAPEATPAPPPRRRPPDMAVPPDPATAVYNEEGKLVTKQAQEDARLAIAAGEVAMQKNLQQDAINHFKRALRLDPRANCLRQLGDAWRDLSRKEDDVAKKKADLDQAIRTYRKKPSLAQFADELEAELKSLQ